MSIELPLQFDNRILHILFTSLFDHCRLSVPPKRLIKLKPICYVLSARKLFSPLLHCPLLSLACYRTMTGFVLPCRKTPWEISICGRGSDKGLILATNFNTLSGPSWFFVRAHDVIKLLLIVEPVDFFGGFSVMPPAIPRSGD